MQKEGNGGKYLKSDLIDSRYSDVSTYAQAIPIVPIKVVNVPFSFVRVSPPAIAPVCDCLSSDLHARSRIVIHGLDVTSVPGGIVSPPKTRPEPATKR